MLLSPHLDSSLNTPSPVAFSSLFPFLAAMSLPKNQISHVQLVFKKKNTHPAVRPSVEQRRLAPGHREVSALRTCRRCLLFHRQFTSIQTVDSDKLCAGGGHR